MSKRPVFFDMKKHLFGYVSLGVGGIFLAMIGGYFALQFALEYAWSAWFSMPEREVVSLDTGELFLLKEMGVLGGDGVQHWVLYKQNPKQKVGDAYRREGESMGSLPVYDAHRNIVMYYDSDSNQVYGAMKTCWGNVGGLKKFENVLLGVSGLVPRSFTSGPVSALGEDGSMTFVMSGDASCYPSFPVHSSIIVNKIASLVASVPGPVVTSQQLDTYLTVGREYQPLETVLVGDRVAFLMKRTRNGAVGGPTSIHVWIAEGSGSLYHFEFNESMNVDEVKLFLSSLTIK